MSTAEPETPKEGETAGDSEPQDSGTSSQKDLRDAAPDEKVNLREGHEAQRASDRKPLTEEQIDAPSRQTLIMLGVICLVTLICWAAGRAACNYHPPRENQTPRKMTLEERTRSPKDTGIEFGLALAGGDFATAEKLSIKDALQLVQQEKASCANCAARKKAADELLGRAVVHRANSVDAIVEVTTQGGPTGKTVRTLGVERQGRDFRVSRVFSSPAEAELLPAPEPQGPAEPPAPEGSEPEGAPGEDQGSGAQSDAEQRPAGPDAKPPVED